MNIFYLHHVPKIAAGMHCDKHVGKMLIESCQMLATAHHHYGNGHMVSYKPTHINHPSNVWVRQYRLHYDWLGDLVSALGKEFFRRYNHHHKSYTVYINELRFAPPAMQKLPLLWQDPPLAMPDEYKSDDTVMAYRRFYASKIDRMPMVYYKGQQKPPIWLTDIWSGRIEHSEHYMEAA